MNRRKRTVWKLTDEDTLSIPVSLTIRRYKIIAIRREYRDYFNIESLNFNQKEEEPTIKIEINNKIEEIPVSRIYAAMVTTYRLKLVWSSELNNAIESIPPNDIRKYNIIFRKSNNIYKVNLVKND